MKKYISIFISLSFLLSNPALLCMKKTIEYDDIPANSSRRKKKRAPEDGMLMHIEQDFPEESQQDDELSEEGLSDDVMRYKVLPHCDLETILSLGVTNRRARTLVGDFIISEDLNGCVAIISDLESLRRDGALKYGEIEKLLESIKARLKNEDHLYFKNKKKIMFINRDNYKRKIIEALENEIDLSIEKLQVSTDRLEKRVCAAWPYLCSIAALSCLASCCCSDALISLITLSPCLTITSCGLCKIIKLGGSSKVLRFCKKRKGRFGERLRNVIYDDKDKKDK